MNAFLTLGGLAVAPLHKLAVTFGYLPAPTVWMSPIDPERLELAFHDELDAFEAWREALDIAPDAVAYGTQADGRTRVLSASTTYAGTGLDLVAYARIPDRP
ncbi:hypothetical protein EKH77_17460 [Streptomyces luteoverticillatus]|uniref:Uncharacterized protein n=1 Tax=Streptomyces luteoverticillatus TaxID=66425 RepID=A0A3S9PKB0_STRLT|nr:hypothetical protein [Streptomyces luteoverticillatus]AZQ72771.1 hypothetical protein EKH77_17460 [Streptomyces luteoverticillatus]